MKQSFRELCSEFVRRAQYTVANFRDFPAKPVMDILEQQGYKTDHLNTQELQTYAQLNEAGRGMGVVIPPSKTIRNKFGQSVTLGVNFEAEEQYKRDKRQAAATVFQIGQ